MQFFMKDCMGKKHVKAENTVRMLKKPHMLEKNGLWRVSKVRPDNGGASSLWP